MYEDRAVHQGEVIDRDLVQYDKVLTEFDAMLRDLSHPQGQIETRNGGSIYFTAREDHAAYRGHVDRIDQLDRERRAAQKAEASQRH
jgi:hypothetical protein